MHLSVVPIVVVVVLGTSINLGSDNVASLYSYLIDIVVIAVEGYGSTACVCALRTDELVGPTDILYNPWTETPELLLTNIVVGTRKFIVLTIDAGVLTVYNVVISANDRTLLYILISAICPTNPRPPSPLAPIVKSFVTDKYCPALPLPVARCVPLIYKIQLTGFVLDNV